VVEVAEEGLSFKRRGGREGKGFGYELVAWHTCGGWHEEAATGTTWRGRQGATRPPLCAVGCGVPGGRGRINAGTRTRSPLPRAGKNAPPSNTSCDGGKGLSKCGHDRRLPAFDAEAVVGWCGPEGGGRGGGGVREKECVSEDGETKKDANNTALVSSPTSGRAGRARWGRREITHRPRLRGAAAPYLEVACFLRGGGEGIVREQWRRNE
jgi:hypothetical protein